MYPFVLRAQQIKLASSVRVVSLMPTLDLTAGADVGFELRR